MRETSGKLRSTVKTAAQISTNHARIFRDPVVRRAWCSPERTCFGPIMIARAHLDELAVLVSRRLLQNLRYAASSSIPVWRIKNPPWPAQ